MTTFTLEPQYLFKLASMPRGFNTKQAVNHACNVPSKHISIDYLGNCFMCECEGWLPLPVGKVLDFASISEVFSSRQAKLLQSDVSERQFSWCAIDHCGIRTSDHIKDVVELAINIDESCNLQCPSCRRDLVMHTQGVEYELKLEYVKRITQWLEQWDERIHIVMSGNGDPLASNVMRYLILNFVPNPLQTFTFKTNGLLIKKMLGKLPILDHITNFSISVDAGSENVYQDVRRPAKWNVLIENLEFLRDIGKNSITSLNFALQNKNYQDVHAFVDLCQNYGFTAFIHQLDDWGTWSIIEPEVKDSWTIKNGTFDRQDVLSSNHPNYLATKNIMQTYTTHQRVRISPMVLSKLDIVEKKLSPED